MRKIGANDGDNLMVDVLRSSPCWDTRWIRAHVRVVAVQQVHHSGNKPVELVCAQEQAGLAALLKPLMPPDVSGQIISGSVQQLQARVILKAPRSALSGKNRGGSRGGGAPSRYAHAASLNSRQCVRLTGEQTGRHYSPMHAAIQGISC